MAFDGKPPQAGSSPDHGNETPPTHVIDAGEGVLVVPGGGSLLVADFVRSGSDLLVLAPDGDRILIKGYFALEFPPTLMTSGGAALQPDLVAALAGPVAPGQYAQSEDVIQAEPIGRVEESVGDVSATRADGSQARLDVDSSVYQGDIIETSADGAVGILFIDSSTFSLGEDARMVLDEMIFDPTNMEGSSVFSVVQGVFVFVSGDIASNNPDEMVVRTPVATLGIRGTKVAGYAAMEGEENRVVLLGEEDWSVGELVISNASGQVVLSEANQGTVITSSLLSPKEPYIFSSAEIQSDFGRAISTLSSVQVRQAATRAERNDDPSNRQNDSDDDDAPTEEELEELAAIEPEAGEEAAGWMKGCSACSGWILSVCWHLRPN